MSKSDDNINANNQKSEEKGATTTLVEHDVKNGLPHSATWLSLEDEDASVESVEKNTSDEQV